ARGRRPTLRVGARTTSASARRLATGGDVRRATGNPRRQAQGGWQPAGAGAERLATGGAVLATSPRRHAETARSYATHFHGDVDKAPAGTGGRDRRRGHAGETGAEGPAQGTGAAFRTPTFAPRASP